MRKYLLLVPAQYMCRYEVMAESADDAMEKFNNGNEPTCKQYVEPEFLEHMDEDCWEAEELDD